MSTKRGSGLLTIRSSNKTRRISGVSVSDPPPNAHARQSWFPRLESEEVPQQPTPQMGYVSFVADVATEKVVQNYRKGGNKMTDYSASLFDRLGGTYGIGAVMDDLARRLMDDPVLNANPNIREAHERITHGGFAYLLTEFVADAAGGPQNYTGRTMPESHDHLKISNDEWEAFMHAVRQSLFTFEVPKAERDEVLALTESLKSEIVREGAVIDV